MKAIGALNGNSHTSGYVREVQNETPQVQTVKTFDLNAFAERAALRYDIALMMVRDAHPKGEMLVTEYEKQLQLLTAFVEGESEIMQ